MAQSNSSGDCQLRQDTPTAAAGLLCFLCLLLHTVGIVVMLVPGSQIEARGSPLYWLLLALPTLWGAGLFEYKRWHLRSIRRLLFASPFFAGAVAVAAWSSAQEMTPYRIMIALVALLALVGGLCFNRSMLARSDAAGRG